MTTSFDMKDVQKIKRGVKDIDAVLPLIETSAKFKHRSNEKELTVVATDYIYGEISNSIPEEGSGRWFTKEEEDKNSNVGVLGFQASEDLFGSENPLNKTVTVLGKNIKIVGVVKRKGGGGMGGGSVDLAIYVPLNLGISIVGNDKIQSIIVKASNKEDIESVKKQVEKVMLEKFDEDAFSVVDQSQILSSINSILGTLTLALTGIAAISLLVGGIGIMNIMLVTVSERTREIGLRKAVGGSPRAILLQFLFEAVILSCIGGILGVLLGILATKLINNFFPAQVTLNSILLAFLVSSGVGVVFGIQPAYKASKLSPIEALRYE
jgi:putative ABC transport system permease protein